MKRNPVGHFISRDCMLGAWLPVMLSWVCRTENRVVGYFETHGRLSLSNNTRLRLLASPRSLAYGMIST